MKQKEFWENFIIVAIILVIIQTFLYELGMYQHWSITARTVLIFSGLLFDIIFSVEFVVRSIISARKNGASRYWLYERGWVDFLSSLPLLLLDSGPTVYFLLAGGAEDATQAIGVLNILKVVKAIRVTRILRLVRIIKIFGKVHNTESRMAQHHTATIATTAVFTVICTLMGFALFTDSSGTGEIDRRMAYYTEFFTSVGDMKADKGAEDWQIAGNILRRDRNVLELRYNERHLFSRISDEKLRDYYSPDDYVRIQAGSFNAMISVVDVHQRVALDHMKNFFIIIFIVLAFMLVYTRHFAQTISDMIHIMNKGFRKKDYNLQVKIRDEYIDQEIFKLAGFYNNAYLPAKLKRIQSGEEKKRSGLSMKDLADFQK